MGVFVQLRHLGFCLPWLLLVTGGGPYGVTPVSCGAAGHLWSTVPTVVVVAPEDDPRVPATQEAIAFWHQTFAELGTPFRFSALQQTTTPVALAYLQALSAQAAVGRGGLVALPEPLEDVPGDLFVVLADGAFISFTATALAASGAKVVVGIQGHDQYPMTLPNVIRNVIAHELGHAVGLGHNADPTTLMCGRPAPCRPEAWQSPTVRFFPLTEAEKARLKLLYPPTWPSR